MYIYNVYIYCSVDPTIVHIEYIYIIIITIKKNIITISISVIPDIILKYMVIKPFIC